jgi:hypothetical protein
MLLFGEATNPSNGFYEAFVEASNDITVSPSRSWKGAD